MLFFLFVQFKCLYLFNWYVFVFACIIFMLYIYLFKKKTVYYYRTKNGLGFDEIVNIFFSLKSN